MNRRDTNRLIIIILLFAFSLWIDLSKEISIPNPFSSTGTPLLSRNVETRLGLDLRGGLQTLLEADVQITVKQHLRIRFHGITADKEADLLDTEVGTRTKRGEVRRWLNVTLNGIRRAEQDFRSAQFIGHNLEHLGLERS